MLVNIHFSKYHIWKPLAPLHARVMTWRWPELWVMTWAYWSKIFSAGCSGSNFASIAIWNYKQYECAVDSKLNHVTERKKCQNLVKCCSVSCKVEWINETAPQWTSENNLSKTSWYRFGVSWKIVVFIVQSGLKQYDFSIVDGELNVVVPGSEAADWICRGKQQWIKQLGKLSFNLFCITFSLSEHLELLELRATSTAGKAMLFRVVYRRKKCRLFFFSLFTLILVANHRKRVTLKYY